MGCSSSHRCLPVGMIPRVDLLLFSLAIISTVTIHFGKALAAPVTQRARRHIRTDMQGGCDGLAAEQRCISRVSSIS